MGPADQRFLKERLVIRELLATFIRTIFTFQAYMYAFLYTLNFNCLTDHIEKTSAFRNTLIQSLCARFFYGFILTNEKKDIPLWNYH